MQHQLEISDNGKTVHASPGDELIIRLEENPTTGYLWELDNDSSGPWALTESNYDLFANAGVGGGGSRTLCFKLGEGQGKLTLKHWQRWSGDVHQFFSVTVLCN